MSFFIAFPWHRVCPRWVFWFVFCFLCKRVPRCRRISSSNWRWGSPQCWGVTENLPPFFCLIFALIFNFFLFWSVWVFIFPARLGGHEAKGTKWPHSAILCQRRRSGSRGWFCPSSRRLKIPLETRGPDFPLRSPPCPWHALAPTQRLKVVSAFKAETLLFSGFLLPPPPFHSVLLNEPDQLLKASEPFQLLSEVGSF